MYPESYRAATGAEVFALQVREDTIDAVSQWTGGEKIKLTNNRFETPLTILGVRVETVIGPRVAHYGEWVIQYKNSDLYFYVLGKAEFEVSYTNV